MKKGWIIILFLMLAVAGLYSEVLAGMYHPGTSADMNTLPDLRVTARIIKVEKFRNAKGVQCYGIRPYFTITNNGGTVARNFRYEIEWNANPAHTWQIYTLKNNVSLGPNNTISIDGSSPVWNLPWCVDEHDWTPGWRITVDTENSVRETNENNNTAVKYFHLIKGRPPARFQPGSGN